MRLIIVVLRNIINKQIIRKIYWFYNLTNAIEFPIKQLEFPIISEGKGRMKIGKYSELTNSEISVGRDSILRIDQRSKFRKGSILKVGFNVKVEIGEDFLLENNSRMYLSKNSNIGKKVEIATYCSIFSREEPTSGNLRIGNNVQIGDFNIIDLTGNVEIGSDVALGPNCVIYSHEHDYRKNTSKIAWKGELIVASVKIEDGAWIGSGVTILPGVTIGKSAIIAAGSIITKNVPENTLWAGVPARQIKFIN
jgi:acetyltransferase-like isoleucine patch superfamily enzyme